MYSIVFFFKIENIMCILLYVFVFIILLFFLVGVVWIFMEWYGFLMCCVIILLMVGRLFCCCIFNFM